MLVLGIESSCDDTAVALVDNGQKIVAGARASQEKIHAQYGGIVPEVACRVHYETMLPLLDKVCKDAGIALKDVDAIAATNQPGLVGSLYVGLSTAKALAWSLNKPLVTVDHIEAHIYAAHLDDPELDFPHVSVVVSGGHTDIFLSTGPTEHQLITRTLDDAAGECFDKVAALLGVGYPGGPAIQMTSLGGDRDAINFPRGEGGPEGLQISFSGLKTAVLNDLRKRGFVVEAAKNAGRLLTAHTPETPVPKSDTRTLSVKLPLADIAASFQEAAVDILIRATLASTRKARCKSVVVTGGVAANKRLREKLAAACKAQKNTRFSAPPLNLCTDNAEMIAGLGFHKLVVGQVAGLDADVLPNKDEKRQKAEKS
ncbi:MAG: tRNA (adenosine(37)-N6)-threonylcarbamoyltransferase complex transferase subunit TsaD [Planctomycetes bacterium]|nr:tRNA (adenosine(37)-N6)-threonylcarbamoyltransferase complex transferase subunit TsaD [Planctomycetota bacterium]